MILKVKFGCERIDQTHTRLIACDDIHIQDNEIEKCVELVWHHSGALRHGSLMLGRTVHADHLYVMENGKTVDHMTYVSDKAYE